MKRKRLARQLTLGALVTGLVPLTAAAGAGAGPAEGRAGLCRSTFGEQGPSGGQVVGEGPSGDPMPITIGWEPNEWADGLGQIVTCMSVAGHGVASLTSVTDNPPNTGSLTLALTLPAGDPGSLACEQSVLVGRGATEGRTGLTSPVCFKLRASDPPPPTGHGRTTRDATPAGPKAPPGPPAPAGQPARPAPAAELARSTPPARASFEAALGGLPIPGLAGVVAKAPVASAAAVAAPAATAAPAVAAPAASGGAAGGAAPVRSSAVPGAPVTSLARTGFDHRVPLAGAGGFLAIGGLSILFGAPGRRKSPA
ncbi:MAG TPA: hypothetical protein VHL53_15365 [Acidimicrobiia bacterium]|nr:hypothetical protein [Acidimicrobiia bacterium]